ncbi:hypothetical protein [Flavobacterium aciduliphilum]|uniref:Uncharacterized protein n=1 Tax=Flavobacterium aciduliphilum TaxID=1101402 RepID=A0A328YIJ5_9FLAO|nr:hypothetical protein [Flavobacterium aciduliphilum]RAR73861.1 hypothetical protein CLV55_103180 [Flavobacterium aciduliphilum]
MVDYRYITAVPSNFNYEEVLAKNHSYKTENKNLKIILFVIGVCVLGATIYFVNEELNKKKDSI